MIIWAATPKKTVAENAIFDENAHKKWLMHLYAERALLERLSTGANVHEEPLRSIVETTRRTLADREDAAKPDPTTI